MIASTPNNDPDAEAADPAPHPMSRLRHDFVTPVNHILGFCELLIDDAHAHGFLDWVGPFETIQKLAWEATAAIDGVFQEAIRDDRLVDRSVLGSRLKSPCETIVTICEAIRQASESRSLSPTFLEDLEKVHEAASQLLAWTNPHAPTAS
jgi:hypothetical protein